MIESSKTKSKENRLTLKKPKKRSKTKIQMRKTVLHTEISGMRQKKREVHSSTGLPQETRQMPNNPTLHLKKLEKEEQMKPKISRRKNIIKIRGEINEIEI